jgi:pyridoxal phosphate enzyme (YggS family)
MIADIEENLRAVQERIEHAAARAGRDPKDITLVAVSKTFSPELILKAYAFGVRHFGENRVEEATEKIPKVVERTEPDNPISWHMVGHLQSRKVREAVPLFDWIESVDSVALARRIENRAAAMNKSLPILLEVNVSGEASKFGMPPEPRQALDAAIQEMIALPHLDLQGLMTVAPIVSNPDDARPFFRALRELRDDLRVRFPERAWHHLSMGMTDDYEVAIAEGATIVRIGRAIFGARPCPV